MTVEHRLFIGLADIRGVTLECKHCTARLSMAPDNIEPDALSKCPVCGHRWLSTASGTGKMFSSTVVSFLAGLRGTLESQDDAGDTSVGVRIFFEVAETSVGQPPSA